MSWVFAGGGGLLVAAAIAEQSEYEKRRQQLYVEAQRDDWHGQVVPLSEQTIRFQNLVLFGTTHPEVYE